MKRGALLAAVVVAAAIGTMVAGAGATSSSSPEFIAAASQREWHANVIVERRVEIAMRDGVVLRATLFRPDDPGKFPAIVFRTPYSQEDAAGESAFPVKAAHRGYLVFLVDVRGRYTSDGEFEAYRNEKQDGHDVIEWVASSPHANGKVGSYGGSYPGIVQWLALSQDPPHYTTAVPTMTPVSSHHFFYLGGAFNLTWFDWFMPWIVPDLRRRAGDDTGPWDSRAAYEEWVPVRQQWYMSRPLVGPPLLRQHAPYYYEWLEHPDESDWWSFADVEQEFSRIRVPVYIVTGWFDNSYGSIGARRGFRGMRQQAATAEARDLTKLIIGPWTHTSVEVLKTSFGDLDFGPNAGLDFDEFLLRWYDQRLKGVDNGVDDEPSVRIFVMGENRWRSVDDWPPPDAENELFFLHGDSTNDSAAGFEGTLGSSPSALGRSSTTYLFDPDNPVWDERFEDPGPHEQSAFADRADVLVFETPPLAEAVDVIGDVVADLYVSVDRPDTDLAVMLVDVHPDGRAYNVMGPESGYLRLRYREGYDHQVLLQPDEIVRVEVGNMLTANRFLKGHRIRIQISSSRAPHFDPNPNTGDEIATATRLVPATVTIHHDAQHPSRVQLPIVRTAAGSDDGR